MRVIFYVKDISLRKIKKYAYLNLMSLGNENLYTHKI